MAMNMIQRYTKTEVWEVGSNKAPGSPVIQATSGFPSAGGAPRPGVTITGSGDYVPPNVTVGPYTLSAAAGVRGGVGLGATKATVAIDGAFAFDVTGATNAIAAGVVIYAVGTAPNVTSLTTTASTNTPFGIVDRFIGEKSGTQTSVFIGRFVDLTA
jgi:hypothetical protein